MAIEETRRPAARRAEPRAAASRVSGISRHLRAPEREGELEAEATRKDFLQVRREGARDVRRALKHYSLPAILAVGYRVRSVRGTQFRQWATARLEELVVKGFTLGDAPSGLRRGGECDRVQ